MFKEEREELKFDWSMIGNIGEGRPNLGNTMDVSVYRLMQFTLRDVLIKNYDAETADRIFYEAGKHAGQEFCKELITQKDDFNEFVVEFPAGFQKTYQRLLKKKMIAGLPLDGFYPELKNHYLLCVTETITKADMDALVQEIKK